MSSVFIAFFAASGTSELVGLYQLERAPNAPALLPMTAPPPAEPTTEEVVRRRSGRRICVNNVFEFDNRPCLPEYEPQVELEQPEDDELLLTGADDGSHPLCGSEAHLSMTVVTDHPGGSLAMIETADRAVPFRVGDRIPDLGLITRIGWRGVLIDAVDGPSCRLVLYTLPEQVATAQPAPAGGRHATSCRELYEHGERNSGIYSIDPDGPGERYEPFLVECDMERRGGGWTMITPAIAHRYLQGEMTAVDRAREADIDAAGRPHTLDARGSHTYHYTFQFPAGFSEFILDDYELRAHGSSEREDTADIDPGRFQQRRWSRAWGNCRGDVAFGTVEDGVVTSFSDQGVEVECVSCTAALPTGTRAFELGGQRSAFRIGWGEACREWEGWYPWWSGTINLR